MGRFATVLLAMTVLPALSGCAVFDRDANADDIARTGGLRRELIRTDPFVLTAFVRISDPHRSVDVYIEGDGLAWLSRIEPSLDPTPERALGLSLAALDPAPNVVYLARPCQFTPMAMNPSCNVSYWTNKRFAPEVIASMGQAIDQIAAQAPGQKINLVGYSGGGAVVVLVAARRHDVASIRTVAGNLDHAEVNRLHGVSPLTGSLNAMDVVRQVADIPQIHFSGAEDRTVPPIIAEQFRSAADSSCVKTETIPGATHEARWKEVWTDLLSETPHCDGATTP